MSTLAPVPDDLQRTYPVKLGYKLFLGIGGGVMLASSLFLVVFPFTGYPAKSPVGYVWLVVLSLAGGLMALACISSGLRSKLTLTGTTVSVSGFFDTRMLPIAEILGRRLIRVQNSPSVIKLVPRSTALKPLKITRMYQTDRVFDGWVESLPDLDKIDRDAAQKEMEADPRLGATPEKRRTTVMYTSALAIYAHGFVMLLTIWCFIAPRPYRLIVLLTAALPWLAVLATGLSRGLLTMNSRAKGAFLNVFTALFFPGLVLLARGTRDFSTASWNGIFIAAAVIGVALTSGLVAVDSSLRWKPRLIVFVALAIGAPYGLGAASVGNAVFDRSPTQFYRPEVMDKRVNNGRPTEYRFQLAPWGTVRQATWVTVPRWLYARTEVSQQVCVYMHQGEFGSPWFHTNACSS